MKGGGAASNTTPTSRGGDTGAGATFSDYSSSQSYNGVDMDNLGLSVETDQPGHLFSASESGIGSQSRTPEGSPRLGTSSSPSSSIGEQDRRSPEVLARFYRHKGHVRIFFRTPSPLI